MKKEEMVKKVYNVECDFSEGYIADIFTIEVGRETAKCYYLSENEGIIYGSNRISKSNCFTSLAKAKEFAIKLEKRNIKDLERKIKALEKNIKMLKSSIAKKQK